MQEGRTSARAPGVTAGDLQTGARIGRYVIIERVGSGAMGVVYGAYDPELDRKIALKLLKPGQGAKPTARARLLREAKAIARLSHPNVVAVHDVGVFEDQVFLAMEFVPGGTIKSWLAEKPRGWREILDVFSSAGRGLTAAHAAGLVHRDFKPDNVLLDREGRPRVVDFGIAREAAGAAGDEDGVEAPSEPAPALRESSGNVAPLMTLTKTGALVGTPAYMAPEQFMGQRGDERSDQFSFCVALYEALYGVRPFEGEDVLSLSLNVTQEQLRPLPKDRNVPAWIRRAILRGMKVDRAARWESMARLVTALADDPAAKLRRRLIAAGAITLVIATVLGAWRIVSRGRAQAEREIARHVEDGSRAMRAAQANAARARELRTRAFAAFDEMNPSEGEARWREVRGLLPAVDAGYDQAERSFETALMLDPSREENRARVADLRYEHLLFADAFRQANKASLLAERLSAVDADGSRRKALVAPGTLVLRTSPAASKVILERYERDPVTGRRIGRPVAAPVDRSATTLAPGSYRLRLEGPGLAPVAYPFEVGRGERVTVDLKLPAAASVPAGFVYVPPGEFLFGEANEELRTQFLSAVPLHPRRTEAFLIARHETTYQDWIAFLEALPAAERRGYEPNVTTTMRGSLRLQELPEGWRLSFQPTTHKYSASAGQPVAYAGRNKRARQNWLRFPVAGISPSEGARYFKWLTETGRLPGARWCSDAEWERAARGADDRVFPHGDSLEPEDANFDVTYGRVDSAYGPDEVGSYSASRSPFEVEDLAGNLFELVTSSVEPAQMVVRGGGYYYAAANSRSSNRQIVPAGFRDVTTGIRVCSSVKGP